MLFKEYFNSLSADEKSMLAIKLDTSKQYLYQLANGHRNPGNKILKKIEKATRGKLKVSDFFKGE